MGKPDAGWRAPVRKWNILFLQRDTAIDAGRPIASGDVPPTDSFGWRRFCLDALA
jgi:hypothetical protein